MKAEMILDSLSASRVMNSLTVQRSIVSTVARTAANSAANKVLDKAQEKVPVDTGAVKNSGRVDHNWDDDELAISIISYGSTGVGRHNIPTVVYAPIVHELRSKKNPESYKWLEKALLESGEVFREEVRRLIGQALKD